VVPCEVIPDAPRDSIEHSRSMTVSAVTPQAWPCSPKSTP